MFPLPAADADFVVKVVDVYPGNYPQPELPEGQRPPANAVRMGGYQQLRSRRAFSRQVSQQSGKARAICRRTNLLAINFDLPDVYHAFRRGHRIMVQVQSSWFPLVDRNPQKFMEIPRAGASDFQKATQRVYRGRDLSSSITVFVEGNSLKLEGARP